MVESGVGCATSAGRLVPLPLPVAEIVMVFGLEVLTVTFDPATMDVVALVRPLIAEIPVPPHPEPVQFPLTTRFCTVVVVPVIVTALGIDTPLLALPIMIVDAEEVPIEIVPVASMDIPELPVTVLLLKVSAAKTRGAPIATEVIAMKPKNNRSPLTRLGLWFIY